MPQRSVSTRDDIIAILFFDGVGDTGSTLGEERAITGYTLTNNAVHNGQPVAIRVKVEEERNKQRTWTRVVQPGQTLEDLSIPPAARPIQYWNQIGPIFLWDGINVEFTVPA
jgi:hypothetical protein